MKKWLKQCCSILIVLTLLLGMTACGGQGEGKSNPEGVEQGGEELTKVNLVLDWSPNTNHTGLYVAKAKGYFADQGLDVEIILPGEAGADQMVATGKAEFGVSYQESVTQARVQGVPLVSIAAIIQHNTSGFGSPLEKNITSPKDFEGKNYGGWGAPVEKAVMGSLMQLDGADVDKVNFINMGETDFFTAVKRDIDFAWVFYAWTGIEAELRGEPINMVYLTEYTEKLDYYTPLLATNETMIAEQPEVVQAFVTAASQGYQFAIENPEEAAQILLEAVPDLDQALVEKSQAWLASRYQADAPRWGEQKREVWENYANWMLEHELLEQELDIDQAFTNQFLPE